MKTTKHIVIVTLITLAVSGLFALSTAAAQEPAAGLLISSGDLRFLERGNAGVQTPVSVQPPVGLFSANEAQHLAAPYVPVETPPAFAARNAVPGLMISATDLRFIVAPGASDGGLPETWAAAPDRFAFGQ